MSEERRDLFGLSLEVGDHVIFPSGHTTGPLVHGVVLKICKKTVKVEGLNKTSNHSAAGCVTYMRAHDQIIKITAEMEWLLP